MLKHLKIMYQGWNYKERGEEGAPTSPGNIKRGGGEGAIFYDKTEKY